jgi:hypothetical protein
MATPPVFSVGQVLTAAQVNAIGLWKITPSTVSGTGVSIGSNGDVIFSGASAAVINDAFPADFVHFRFVFFDMVGSTTVQQILFQLRSTTNVTTNYRSGGRVQLYTGTTFEGNGITDRIAVGGVASTGKTSVSCDVYNPNVAVITGYSSLGSNFDAYISYGGQNTNTTAYSNCAVGVASGTFTGKVSIYGYR